MPSVMKKTGMIIPIKNIEFKKRDDDLFSDTKSNRMDSASERGTFTN